MSEQLSVGDRIKDNDPRMGDRVLVVTEVNSTHVVASRNGVGLWPTKLLKSRVFLDNKLRKTGFTRISCGEKV